MILFSGNIRRLWIVAGVPPGGLGASNDNGVDNCTSYNALVVSGNPYGAET